MNCGCACARGGGSCTAAFSWPCKERERERECVAVFACCLPRSEPQDVSFNLHVIIVCSGQEGRIPTVDDIILNWLCCRLRGIFLVAHVQQGRSGGTSNRSCKNPARTCGCAYACGRVGIAQPSLPVEREREREREKLTCCGGRAARHVLSARASVLCRDYKQHSVLGPCSL